MMPELIELLIEILGEVRLMNELLTEIETQ